ncbi:MAG TPA: leucyl aminopeptidase [Rhodothermales bacterium]|nr:leucyl aminopeptidase [Rhodothermales bacterium]
MKLKIHVNALQTISSDVLILPLFEEDSADKLAKWVKKFGQTLEAAAKDFSGQKGQTQLLYPTEGRAKRLLLMGFGKTSDATMESIRQGIAASAAVVRNVGAAKVTMALPGCFLETADVSQALTEGLLLALYQFDRYKTSKKEVLFAPKQLGIWTKSQPNAAKKGAEAGKVVAEAVCRARDLVNLSPNEKTPHILANEAREDAQKWGFNIEIWEKKRIEAEKFGGLLAVNLGSPEPPAFMILEWKPEKALNEKPLVLVGKGVVYDTGGLSLKPTKDSMDHMKCDMSGAAAVIATFQALSRMDLPLQVIGLIPATDNRPSGNAYVPGDVIRMHNGMTVEVLNTDAEGRMILADALSWAQQYDPELVIDIATLTGAQVVALGNFVAGIMTNEDAKAQERLTLLQEAGMRSGDWVHPLPMFPAFGDLVKSTVADLKNVGGPAAGTITAGKFLEHFTNYPWVHVDIAGPAWIATPRHYQPAGGTGFGTKLLIEFLRMRVQQADAKPEISEQAELA